MSQQGPVYRIVVGSSAPQLEDSVQEFMQKGYLLTGGLCIIPGRVANNYWFSQAVYKPKAFYISDKVLKEVTQQLADRGLSPTARFPSDPEIQKL